MISMIQETKAFKKRFHMCGVPEKISIAKLLGELVKKNIMPGGRKMSKDESDLLFELLEWCNQNTFFDITPKYGTPTF